MPEQNVVLFQLFYLTVFPTSMEIIKHCQEFFMYIYQE